MTTETNKAAKNKFDELKEAAKPLQEYLLKNWHLHCKAIVSIVKVEILEGQILTPTLELLD